MPPRAPPMCSNALCLLWNNLKRSYESFQGYLFSKKFYLYAPYSKGAMNCTDVSSLSLGIGISLLDLVIAIFAFLPSALTYNSMIRCAFSLLATAECRKAA